MLFLLRNAWNKETTNISQSSNLYSWMKRIWMLLLPNRKIIIWTRLVPGSWIAKQQEFGQQEIPAPSQNIYPNYPSPMFRQWESRCKGCLPGTLPSGHQDLGSQHLNQPMDMAALPPPNLRDVCCSSLTKTKNDETRLFTSSQSKNGFPPRVPSVKPSLIYSITEQKQNMSPHWLPGNASLQLQLLAAP